MTITELFSACAEQKEMPKVKIGNQTGIVTQIRPTGCAVRIDGMNYDNWYYAEDGTDKRSRYMSALSLLLEMEPTVKGESENNYGVE